jgi:transglutaminase-like putative cysteine protease
MRTMARYLASGLLALVLPTCAEAQLVIRQAVVDVDVRPDGSMVQTAHVAMRATNDAAAQRIAQRPIVFSASREELTILEAYTQKPDGRKLPVDAGAIHAQLVPGSPNLTLFNDQEQKVIVFPSVAAQDTLVYTIRREVNKPLFPGQFMWQALLDRSMSWHDYQVTITAPASMPLRTEEHGIEAERRQDGERVVYHFHATYPDAQVAEPAAVGPFQRLPRAFVSSMPDYAAMARAYGAQAQPKETVTPEIQQLADRLTDGIADRRDQARAIYDWVSTHIRYVAVWLAQGAIEPHAASAVLEVGYGDCKDHAVLFGALLRARGIDSEPVLINLGNEYLLPGPPTLAVLNHVITWLPEFALYVDTTAGVAPFGVLPFQEYGKPVVHTGSTGPVERRTPVLAQDQATETFVTKAKLGSDGTIEGETTTAASGPFSISLRLAARSIDQQGRQPAARAQLKTLGEDGSGSFDFSAPTNIDGDYSVTGSFNLDARPELLDGATFRLPVGLRLLERPGDLLLGPLGQSDLKDSEPTPCHAGRQIETLSLGLPEGWRVARVPQDARIDNALLHYETHWTVAQGQVSVQRELTSTAPGPLCEGDARIRAAHALAAIRRDLDAQIGLAPE